MVFGIYSSKRERIPEGLDVCLEELWKQVWIARAVSNIYVNCCLCVSFCWSSAARRQTQFCAQTCFPGQLRKHSTSRMNTQGGHISSLTGLPSTIPGTPRSVELLKQELWPPRWVRHPPRAAARTARSHVPSWQQSLCSMWWMKTKILQMKHLSSLPQIITENLCFW